MLFRWLSGRKRFEGSTAARMEEPGDSRRAPAVTRAGATRGDHGDRRVRQDEGRRRARHVFRTLSLKPGRGRQRRDAAVVGADPGTRSTGWAAVVAATIALTGCAATGIRVVYHSDPQGATLYENGRPVGQTPLALNYPITDEFRRGACQTARGSEVKWASGATASIPSLRLCPQQGYEQHYTFQRPNVAGRDIDVNYALQLERNRIMRRQAEAAEDAANAQLLRSLQPPPSTMPPGPVNRKDWTSEQCWL